MKLMKNSSISMLAIAKDIVGALERKIQYGKGIIAHISK